MRAIKLIQNICIMYNKTYYAELLLRISESLDKKDSQLKRKLYNIVLLTLDLFETESDKFDNDIIAAKVIRREVGKYYRVHPDYYLMRSRKRELVQARQIAMTLININTKLTLKYIGEMIGNRDHATVIHSRETVNNLFETEKNFRYDLKYLVRKLKLKF